MRRGWVLLAFIWTGEQCCPPAVSILWIWGNRQNGWRRNHSGHETVKQNQKPSARGRGAYAWCAPYCWGGFKRLLIFFLGIMCLYQILQLREPDEWSGHHPIDSTQSEASCLNARRICYIMISMTWPGTAKARVSIKGEILRTMDNWAEPDSRKKRSRRHEHSESAWNRAEKDISVFWLSGCSGWACNDEGKR